MDSSHFKHVLREELAAVETELSSLGRRNPATADSQGLAEWDATPGDFDTVPADAGEQAEKFEALDANKAIMHPLELRWRNLKRALQKIEDDTFGACEVCGRKIEENRLEANPAARTCIAHLEEERRLAL